MADSAADALCGVFVPVVTPFERDTIRLDLLRENLRRLSTTRVSGYLALGSNGESFALDAAEENEVLRVFAEEKSNKIVMVGTGCESTKLTIQKTRIASAMGFKYASVLTPHYFSKQISDEVLHRHYLAIADESPIPIVLYNAPGFAGNVQISPASVASLALHENIVGIKDSSSAGPGELLSLGKLDSNFKVLAGTINTFFCSLIAGATGGVLSLANSLPEACCELFDLCVAGSLERARQLNASLRRINRISSGRYGVAGVKAVMNVMGYHGGEPRAPLLPLTADARRRIEAAIKNEGCSTAS